MTLKEKVAQGRAMSEASRYRSGYYVIVFVAIILSSRFVFLHLQNLHGSVNSTSNVPQFIPKTVLPKQPSSDVPQTAASIPAALVKEVQYQENCFCNLQGTINDDCSCQIDAVDQFNNYKIYPRLQSLLVKDYLRYTQVNLKKDCPFWYDDGACSLESCQVTTCGEDEIPAGIKGQQGLFFRPLTQNPKKKSVQRDCDSNQELGHINTSLSIESQAGFERWKIHDDALVDFCTVKDDDANDDLQYVDLLLNPERYTGYQGPSAHRVWSSIYNENCFREMDNPVAIFGESPKEGSCIEKRTFYRAISGLHTSINIHVSAKYLLSKPNSLFKTSAESLWGPNITEFRRHFGNDRNAETSSQWLKNLYFLYLLELRAISKISGYLHQFKFYTGKTDDDADFKSAIRDLLRTVDSFPFHFDEKALFAGVDAVKLKAEFHNRFTNITKIMDCVGCQKCRLWGKTQIKGLGTALKILFADSFVQRGSFLTRDEIVALLNGFGRLSDSIYQLDNFRSLIQKEERQSRLTTSEKRAQKKDSPFF